MPSRNECYLAGHLGRDAVTKETPTGKRVTNFSIGITRKVGGKEVTDWPNIVAWELNDDVISELVKGAGVHVEGRISTRSYEKDGRKVYVTEVTAHSVSLHQSQRNPTSDDQEGIPF